MRNNPNQSFSVKLSRRTFLGGTVALCISASLISPSSLAAFGHIEATKAETNFKPWISIDENGEIIIYAAATEMGQGSMTALPIIIAEELDADWSKVKVEPSPSDDAIYGTPIFNYAMLTIASISVTSYYESHRMIGAQARKALLSVVAAHWGVALKELSTDAGFVVHAEQNRQISYGDIIRITDLSIIDTQPVTSSDLKNEADFRLIGHDVARVDLPSKIEGTAKYGIDINLPEMVFAAISRSPIDGLKVVSVDEREARKIPGILDVVNLGHGVAVIAKNQWAAFLAKNHLDITWSEIGDVGTFDSELEQENFVAQAEDLSKKGFPWEAVGDVNKSIPNPKLNLSRTYSTDYVYHAGIEPMNAVASVKPDGTVELWAGTQAPTSAIKNVAAALGLPAKNVSLNRSFLGGGFGRRAIRTQEFIVDSARLSKHMSKPVKVVWMREDDVKSGYFKPMTGQFLSGIVDSNNDIVTWRHRVASEEASRMQDPGGATLKKGSPILSMFSSEKTSYNFANRLIEHCEQFTGVRLAAVRGVGATPHYFGSESFIDEVAQELEIDCLEYRLHLLRNSPKALAVMKEVALMSNWGTNSEGRAKGVAFGDYHGSYAAYVAEVSLDAKTNVVKVHNIWLAHDAGLIIQPDNTISQLEGGMVFGLSNALKESIRIRDGKVQNNNYYDYQVLRMNETPELHVKLMPSGGKPTGVGETGAVGVPAAVANAFAALTGKRIRQLPMTPERVKEVLSNKNT
jgi:isoquinoline 1-oxidoreductase beta subunit